MGTALDADGGQVGDIGGKCVAEGKVQRLFCIYEFCLQEPLIE